MAVVIRLKRGGKKKSPFYSIVVADSRCPRDGRNLERIGTYDPMVGKDAVVLDNVRLARWLDNGAVMSATVKSIIKRVKQDGAVTAQSA